MSSGAAARDYDMKKEVLFGIGDDCMSIFFSYTYIHSEQNQYKPFVEELDPCPKSQDKAYK